MSREIFIDLLDELLHQKVTRLLNKQVISIFTTQVVKYGQKGQIWSKRDKYDQKDPKGSTEIKTNSKYEH